jgi:hypothetical protein
MESGASRQWPVWVWYAMVVAILGVMLIADLAGWLAPLDPMRSP